jgi:hypothetical protein
MRVSALPSDRHYAPTARVWLDGVDVTHDCQIAICDEPDEPGAVLVLKRNADGHHYVDEAGEPAREWKQGVVLIHDPATTGGGA